MSEKKLKNVLQSVADYAARVGDATSQVLNVAVFFGDNANESVSGRAYRQRLDAKRWLYLNNAIDFVFSKGHCEEAYLNDISRAAKTLKESKKK